MRHEVTDGDGRRLDERPEIRRQARGRGRGPRVLVSVRVRRAGVRRVSHQGETELEAGEIRLHGDTLALDRPPEGSVGHGQCPAGRQRAEQDRVGLGAMLAGQGERVERHQTLCRGLGRALQIRLRIDGAGRSRSSRGSSRGGASRRSRWCAAARRSRARSCAPPRGTPARPGRRGRRAPDRARTPAPRRRPRRRARRSTWWSRCAGPRRESRCRARAARDPARRPRSTPRARPHPARRRRGSGRRRWPRRSPSRADRDAPC